MKSAIKVGMLSYSFYESDNRVRRYAEELVRQGIAVDVFALRRENQRDYNELNGVRIFRIQKRIRNERGKSTFLFRILKFFFKSALALTRMQLNQPYNIIHVHSVPDFEVFAATIPKIFGAKVILDIHDIVPEFYAAKFNMGKETITYKILVLIEKLSTSFADHVIISNDLWKNTICSRSVRSEKCTSIINYPDQKIFFRRNVKPNKNKFVFMYPGTLNHHQGLDLAIEAFQKIRNIISGAELHIIGDGPAKSKLGQLVKQYQLETRVFFKDTVPLENIADIMASANVGIIPKRNDSFGGEAFSTKSLEFMSLGVPVIISRTKIDQHYFNNSQVRFFEPENIDDLSDAMLDLAFNPLKITKISENALKFAQINSWNLKKKIYLRIINDLIGGTSSNNGQRIPGNAL